MIPARDVFPGISWSSGVSNYSSCLGNALFFSMSNILHGQYNVV